jgi:hypothetical protein
MTFAIGIPSWQNGAIVYTLTSSFKPPWSQVLAPPPSVGLDAYGAPQVKGFGSLTWGWSWMTLGDWYALYQIWLSTRNANLPWARVQVQWPDPASGTNVLATARMETPTMSSRDVAVYHDVQVVFSHLGYEDVAATGFWLPPPDTGAPGP